MGLYGLGGVTISGGTVTATGSTSGIHSNSSISISGGSVTATGGSYVGGIIGYFYTTLLNKPAAAGAVAAIADEEEDF